MENSQKILNFIQNKGISLYRISKALNISESTFSKWRNKPTSKIDLSIAQKIADYFNVGLDDLLDKNQAIKNSSSELSEDELELLTYYNKLDTLNKGRIIGKAEILAELKSPTPIRFCPPTIGRECLEDIEEDENEKDYLYLDLYVLPASAGTGIYMEHSESEPLRVPCTYETENANFALKISGDSMMPKYNDGDVVLVKTQPAVDFGEIGIFIYSGDAYIKKWGGNKLISLNPDYEDILIKDIETLYIKGKVLGKL